MWEMFDNLLEINKKTISYFQGNIKKDFEEIENNIDKRFNVRYEITYYNKKNFLN